MGEEMNHMGMTPYETIKVSEMSRRGNKGVAVTGLVLGSVGLVAAVTGWIYAHGQAKQAKEVALATTNGTQKQLDQMAALLAAERDERITGDRSLSISINDTVSGQQSGTLTQSQQLSNELSLGLMTGRFEEKPQKVALYQDAKPCACPASNGCGCGD